MLRHRNIDRICCVNLALTLLTACGFVGAGAAGLITADTSIGYENRLFDQSRVHTIDIVMNDWNAFIDDATSETYYACTMVIDGEKYGNVAIRGKGNTSLSNVASYGNDRYSFKVEFDHYQSGSTYHGLDKLSLNNLIQDATHMKDYFAYTLMGRMGVAAPLCSFVQINVNGEAWGLYLAVEGVEDSFLTRNYGSDHGELYKPDSMSFGGGRGNGRAFDMDDFTDMFTRQIEDGADDIVQQTPAGMPPFGGGMQGSSTAGMPEMPAGGMNPFGNAQGGGRGFMQQGGMGHAMGSSDVLLQYTDDDLASYSNIFDNAKTDLTDEDKARLITSLRTLSDTETAPAVVDIDRVIRYFVVHNFLCNDDSYTGNMIHNYYLYEEDGVLSMIPWDYNLAFGGFGMGGGTSAAGVPGATGAVNSPIDSPVSSGDVASRPMIAWIFADEGYVGQYHAIYAQMMTECFDNGWFAAEIDRVTEMIAPYVEADANGFFTYDEFVTAAATMREFCLLRAQSVSGQLAGSIPSTTAEQAGNTAALIDASHISVSDMGSMGGDIQMNRGGVGGMRESRGTWDGQGAGQPAADSSAEVPAGTASGLWMPGGMQAPDGIQPPNGMQMPGAAAPGMADAEIPAAAADTPAAVAGRQPSEQGGSNTNSFAGRSSMADVSSDNGEDAWLPMCASVAALLIGLVIAGRFRSGR